MNCLKLLCSLSLIFISLNLQAEGFKVKVPKSLCSDLDIRDKMKSEDLKEHFTRPRSQDSVGWCYAFVTADLLSVETGVPLSSTHVSSISNASIYKEALKNEEDRFYIYKVFDRTMDKASNPKFKSIVEGGSIYWGVKDSVTKGSLCSEKELPFDENGPESTKADLITNIENIKRLQMLNTPTLACQRAKSLIDVLDLNASADEIYKLVLVNNVNIAFEQLASMSCVDPIKLNKSIKVTYEEIPKPNLEKRSRSRLGQKSLKRDKKKIVKAFEKIESLLSIGRPVGISYNVSHITAFEGWHGSSITGRRWNSGRCEYKVRNSWGKDCSSYNYLSIIECNREEGSFWVTEQKLYEMVEGITYIDS